MSQPHKTWSGPVGDPATPLEDTLALLYQLALAYKAELNETRRWDPSKEALFVRVARVTSAAGFPWPPAIGTTGAGPAQVPDLTSR